MSDVTRILSAIEQGDPQASEQLFPLVYQELRRLAAQKMAQEKPGQTLQATALVHEAYLRLVDGKSAMQWDGSRHFFIAAALCMRRILVDRARRKRRLKRGGELCRVPLEDMPIESPSSPLDLLALDEALLHFAKEHPNQAEVVQLRYFAGLELNEIADVQRVSVETVKRHWRFARVWLHRQMNGGSRLED
jgi:RNA polymerase sigma factor (TIGR02999 family)